MEEKEQKGRTVLHIYQCSCTALSIHVFDSIVRMILNKAYLVLNVLFSHGRLSVRRNMEKISLE